MLNASIFSFIFLNLVKKGILDFHVTTTATDICIKEVIDSCFRRALWRKTMKSLISTIIVYKPSQQRSFIFAGLSRI